MMRRDRRLTIGVSVTSLVLMPALMGFLGKVTTTTTTQTAVTAVVVTMDSPIVDSVLGSDPTLGRVQRDEASLYPDRVTISGNSTSLFIQTDRTKPDLWDAAQRLEAALNEYKTQTARNRLLNAGLNPDDFDPFAVQVIDTSSADSRGAAIFGTLVPYLVIVLLVANSIRAVYVAVGEKEKNTLASLLVSQVPREAIVIGKSLAITTFAVIASLLLIVGMVLFASLGFTIAGQALGSVAFTLTTEQTSQLVLNIAGLALVVSSVIMVVGTYARSQREAGVYTAPILFVSIFLAIFSFSNTGFSLPVYAIPILGNAVAMKNTIIDGSALTELAVTLSGNTLVFACLVAVSVAMYRRESVLFRR